MLKVILITLSDINDDTNMLGILSYTCISCYI